MTVEGERGSTKEGTIRDCFTEQEVKGGKKGGHTLDQNIPQAEELKRKELV